MGYFIMINIFVILSSVLSVNSYFDAFYKGCRFTVVENSVVLKIICI